MRVRAIAVLAVLSISAITAPAAAVTNNSTFMVTAQARARAAGGPLLLSFDNGESLRPGSLVENDAGRGGGRVLVADGGGLTRTQGILKRGAGFPCGNCGRAIIEIPDRAALDPSRAPFRFGAAVKLTTAQGRRHSNVVQKGYFKARGGQYKLQIDSGHPSCVVSGSRGRLIARAQVGVSDNTWHRLACARTPDELRLSIDGKIRARATGGVGLVANDAPVRVGGKKVIRGPNEQYHGKLDSVFVSIQRTAR